MPTMLTTQAILKLGELPQVGETDAVKGDLPAVTFTMGAGTWVLWEYDPDQRLGFGLCDLSMGFPEIGYVSINELCDTANSLGMELFCDFRISTRFAGYESLSLEVPRYLVA